ncbi:prealbumin-like fold domain-containing protein [Stenotrophomonas sp. PD6]|uniref:prealbumin-like fold domain-containing protein n=1 Tax=Stenotrophomonas sp. PD6 TaxID=3368612 RepID=UPI003BA256F8
MRLPVSHTALRTPPRRRPGVLWVLLLCVGLAPAVHAQSVQLAKTSQGGVGTFNYTLTNLDGASDAITTTTAGTPTPSATVFTVTDPSAAVTLTEAANAQFTLDTASCVDTSGTVPGSIGVLAGATLTIPAASLPPAATLVCTFVNTQVAPDIAISKQASPTVVASGGTVTFTLTASNVGAVDVTNAVLADAPGTGLSCTAAGSCTASGGATCPASIPAAALFGGGVTVPALPVGGSVAVSVACTVTASGN